MHREEGLTGAGAFLAHRLPFLAPALLAFVALPPPDRPWPSSAVLFAVLSLSRIPVSLERLRGTDDFVTTLPFLGLGLAAGAWYALSGGPALLLVSAEALLGCLLVAILSGFLPPRIGAGWQALFGLTLFALEALLWSWAGSTGRTLSLIAVEAIASCIALWQLAGKRP